MRSDGIVRRSQHARLTGGVLSRTFQLSRILDRAEDDAGGSGVSASLRR